MIVQVVRLKDGFDVVTQIDYQQEEVQFTNPMVFEIRNASLVLHHWLPLAVMEGNSVMIPRDEILCVMEPNDNFRDYYETTINKINGVLEQTKNNEEDTEEMIDAMEELENSKGLSIH